MINWINRYARLIELLPEIEDGKTTILEVGAGQSGIARYLKRSLVALDKSVNGLKGNGILGVAASIDKLPFSDNSFDIVICIDTFEHLLPSTRDPALRELARVCRGRLLVGGPMGYFAQLGDEQYWLELHWRGHQTPNWLDEHLLRGIPTLYEMLLYAENTGHSYRLLGNEALIQHYSGLFADEIPFLNEANAALAIKRTLAPPLAPGKGDVYYSYLLDINIRTVGEIGKANYDLQLPEARQVEFPSNTDKHDLTLYCIGHDIARFPSFKGITRFHTNAADLKTVVNASFVIDDQQPSIRHKNATYSELSAIYFVWRNRRYGRFVGFCHYRRYFDFLSSGTERRMTTIRSAEELASYRPSIEALTTMHDQLQNNGIILSGTELLLPTVAEHYMRYHYPDHYLLAIDLLLKRHPHLKPFVLEQFSQDHGHTNNIFICSAHFFEKLCNWWFDLLFAIEDVIGPINDAYQSRYPAFLAERLFDIYVRWQRAEGISTTELPIFFLADSAFSKPE